MAALVIVLVAERPGEAYGPRTPAGLRVVLRSLPEPLGRAARELVEVRAPAALSLSPTKASCGLPIEFADCPEVGGAVLGLVRPRVGLIDLPPPA
jgi:hypothetical protein